MMKFCDEKICGCGNIALEKTVVDGKGWKS